MVVEGPLVPGADFDRLSAVAFQAGTSAPLSVATLEGAELRLPATFNFQSGPATPAGTRISVRATAELAGVVRSTVSGETTLEPKGGASLRLTLPPIPAPPDGGPAVEVCDNGADDDGDGLNDCADPECDGKSCQPGGLTCGGGTCTCSGGAVGTSLVRQGFARRSQPAALVASTGPLADALVLAGGRDAMGRPSAVLEVYFTAASRLSSRTLAVERAEASLVALGDGGVGVLGGVRTSEVPEPSLEWLELDGGTTRVSFSPSLTARGAAAGRLGSDVVLAGGAMAVAQEGGVEQRNLAVRVNSGTGAQEVLGHLSIPCPAGGAPLGSSFLLAGACAGSGATARTDLIGPTGVLGVGPTLSAALEAPAVVDLTGGRALVVGGFEQVGATRLPTTRAFLLESSGSVVRARELRPMEVPRSAPRAVRAGNGWVYIEDANGAPPVWFDPASERFIPATPLPMRRNHALAGGPGAQVYLAGGTGADGGLEDTLLVLEARCF